MRYFAGIISNPLGTLVAAAIFSGLAFSQAAAAQTGIVVNDVELSIETVQALQQIYPVEIAPGHYWYDVVSGAWGGNGEPVAGQMLAGLELGQGFGNQF